MQDKICFVLTTVLNTLNTFPPPLYITLFSSPITNEDEVTADEGQAVDGLVLNLEKQKKSHMRW